MGDRTPGKNDYKMSKYLADTTLLIEHLRGNIKASIFLKANSPCISTVSIAELIHGSRDKDELRAALKLCDSLSEITIDRKISKYAIGLMKKFYLSKGLKFLDAIIASSALENNLTLIMGNLKHFNFIEGLKIASQKEYTTRR